jgi:hypothetical protein
MLRLDPPRPSVALYHSISRFLSTLSDIESRESGDGGLRVSLVFLPSPSSPLPPPLSTLPRPQIQEALLGPEDLCRHQISPSLSSALTLTRNEDESRAVRRIISSPPVGKMKLCREGKIMATAAKVHASSSSLSRVDIFHFQRLLPFL